MVNQPKILILHGADGTILEINADEVISVEDASSKQSAGYKTRIVLFKQNSDGDNIALLVKEAAAAVTKDLVEAQAAGNWQGQ